MTLMFRLHQNALSRGRPIGEAFFGIDGALAHRAFQ